MALITTAAFKTWVGLTGTGEDTWIDAAIPYAERAIKNWVGYEIESATYTEYYSGNFSRYLFLRQRPVTSITSVHLDQSGRFDFGTSDPFGTSALLTAGDNYVLVLDGFLEGTSTNASLAGMLERVNAVWPGVRRSYSGELSSRNELGSGNIKVVYVAGYSTVPDDIKLAALMYVAELRRIREAGAALSSESLGSYSYSLADPKSSEWKKLLSRYRNIPIGFTN